MMKTKDSSSSTLLGEKPWGCGLPQAFFCKSFACLAWADKLLSHLLPLFLGAFETAVARGSRWERSVFGARQATDYGEGVLSP